MPEIQLTAENVCSYDIRGGQDPDSPNFALRTITKDNGYAAKLQLISRVDRKRADILSR